MVYGISGGTKTSQVYHVVKYILKMNPGKKFRMISSDGGGWAPFSDSGMIDRGEVEIFDYSNRQHALADLRRLSSGYWPRVMTNGEEYFKSTQECMTTVEEWGKIAGYIIEGMTSTAEALKAHISNQTEGVGFKESWKYEEDGYTATGLQMGHYGIVQKEVYERHIKGFNTLPIPWLLYTALVGKGEDKQNRETVYGPQLVGSASTPASPAWFMDVLHLSREKWSGDASPKLKLFNSGNGEHEGMVAWFAPHNDVTTGIPYLVKARIMPELFPRLLEYFPSGFVPLGYKNGLDAYFMVLEKLRKENSDRLLVDMQQEMKKG